MSKDTIDTLLKTIKELRAEIYRKDEMVNWHGDELASYKKALARMMLSMSRMGRDLVEAQTDIGHLKADVEQLKAAERDRAVNDAFVTRKIKAFEPFFLRSREQE